jgi:hypothetical protein
MAATATLHAGAPSYHTDRGSRARLQKCRLGVPMLWGPMACCRAGRAILRSMPQSGSMPPVLPPRPVFTSDNGHCTKSRRDSFGLTTFVRLEGIFWCAALGRTRHTVRLPPLTWSLDGRTLFLSEEHTNTIPIVHTPCHSAAPMLSLPGLAPSGEILSTSHAIRSTQGWA